MRARHPTTLTIAALLLLASCGSSSAIGGDSDHEDGVTDAGIADAALPARHWHIVAGNNSAAIAEAFDAATFGETVYFPAGTYQLTEPLPLQSGVNVLGDPADPPTLEPLGDANMESRSSVANVALRHLQFRNMRLRFDGPDDYSLGNITIEDCRFFDGAVDENWNGSYLLLHQLRAVLVHRSTFERQNSEVGGRGVLLSRCHHCVVKGSFIGTNRNLDEGLGYFKTAINVYGYGSDTLRSRDTKVVGTVMRRQASPTCQYPPSETEGNDVCQDHGVYAWGNRDIQIIDNRIDGWEPTASGNSLKLRNGELMFAERNRFRDSGVMLFTYPREAAITHFEKSIVRRNRFDLANSGTGSADSGLSYYRNIGQPGDTGYESEIHFVGNDFVSGGRVSISRALASEFCVEGNTGVDLAVGNSAGLPALSNCTAASDWDRPLLGVYDGDFNEDGIADVAHLVMEGEDGPTWMLHLRDGDGYRVAAWPASIYAAATTEDYGVHVGDFDGDGHADDLVYWGRYGLDGTPGWRMHSGNGTGFKVVGFGTSLDASADTVTYGVKLGDFDGDGKDDLVYRGSCGTASCWRVQRSTGSAFVAEDWGDGMYASAETATYGIVVGDFNGDGKDDLAYRGRCGSGDPCWRVQLSTGTSFAVGKGFGDAPYFSSDSAHFGLRTGDFDGDGRTDIGYMARCGSNERQWRYQVSTGTSFVVKCAVEARF